MHVAYAAVQHILNTYCCVSSMRKRTGTRKNQKVVTRLGSARLAASHPLPPPLPSPCACPCPEPAQPLPPHLHSNGHAMPSTQCPAQPISRPLALLPPFHLPLPGPCPDLEAPSPCPPAQQSWCHPPESTAALQPPSSPFALLLPWPWPLPCPRPDLAFPSPCSRPAHLHSNDRAIHQGPA